MSRAPNPFPEGTGLYVHFPFCTSKCPYCHFASLPYNPGLYDTWLKGIGKEAGLWKIASPRIDTLYVGGGTPSLIPREGFRALFERLEESFELNLVELTLEVNPGTASREALKDWRSAGVTRISLGVQSFDDGTLAVLGRQYTAAKAMETARECRRAFDDLSLDLMVGVPGETIRALKRTMTGVRRIGPNHVSSYILEMTEGLPFDSVRRAVPMDDEDIVRSYEYVREELAGSGLVRYEISNFAQSGRECRHNLKYWRYEPFIGLGPSAASHFGGKRWSNLRYLTDWALALERGEDLREEVVDLTNERSLLEALVFGLRLAGGIGLDDFQERFGVDVLERYSGPIGELIADRLLVREANRLRIPEDKSLVSNAILSRFV